MCERVVLIAPYPELAELTRQVCRELNLKASIASGDLTEGVKLAEDFIQEGAEVIISRGGTATAIAQKVEIPVVEILVSAFDLVRAIAEAKKFGQKIGVVGFRNVIYGSKSLDQVLGVTIKELEVKSEEEAPAVIEKAAASGIQVIVGDAVSVHWAKNMGLAALLVTSGKEAIGSALREAIELASVGRRERARTEQLKVILDFAYEGIVATDAEGYISLVNQAAERILGVGGNRLLGHPAGEVLSGMALQKVQEMGQPRLGELHRMGNTLLVQNVVPVIADQEIMGVVATFQEASHLQDVETKVRQELYLKGHVARFTFADVITQSPIMRSVMIQAQEFSFSEATVLITGETGSGKELLAQSIHNAGKRKDRPFVAVNCAAVPEGLLESELFGYEEGAFTGARKGGKKGFFELAHHGTLFLDEIGEIPLHLQARLLRVLQQKAVMRVGGDCVIPVDVRIIAATHRDLDTAIQERQFRQDLYYRLNVLGLHIPPLRQRKDDIPLLVNMLLDKICNRTGRARPKLSEKIIEVFKQYPWRGNVRELENVLERLTVLKSNAEVQFEDVQEILDHMEPGSAPETAHVIISLKGSLEEMEQEIIRKTLELTPNKEKACQALGISKTTLWRRLKG